jgi:hypothetical protein
MKKLTAGQMQALLEVAEKRFYTGTDRPAALEAAVAKLKDGLEKQRAWDKERSRRRRQRDEEAETRV